MLNFEITTKVYIGSITSTCYVDAILTMEKKTKLFYF